MKLPNLIRQELDACGLPYELTRSIRHTKIYICGRFAGVVCGGSRKDSSAGRGSLNVRAQIRRLVKELKEGTCQPTTTK